MTSEQAEILIVQLDTLTMVTRLAVVGVASLLGLKFMEIVRDSSAWSHFWGPRS